MELIDLSDGPECYSDPSFITLNVPPIDNHTRMYGSNNPNSSRVDSGHQNEPPPPQERFWTLRFYQKYFDISTDEVITRVIWSMLPFPRVNFLQKCIQDKPDLYGPFWICVTLIFAIAINGNVANYFQATHVSHSTWKYNFHAVSLAGILIFSYSWFFPLLLWGAVKLNSVSEVKFTLLELICIYGYAMTVYIPLTVLWIIPVLWLQWIVTFVGSLLSGIVLCTSLQPAFSQTGYTILVLLLGLHVIVASCFMTFFFHVSSFNFQRASAVEFSTVALTVENFSAV